MSKKLTLRLNQQYELTDEVDVGSDGMFALRDAELIEQLLRWAAPDELDLDALRRVLDDDPRAAATLLRDPSVRATVARRIARGEIVARHAIIERHFASELGDGTEPDDDEEEAVKEFVRDWWFHCEHHPKPYGKRGQEHRHAFGRKYRDRKDGEVNMITVVPDFVDGSATGPSTPGKEKMTFLWKDEELGNPPKPALELTNTSKGTVAVPADGAESGYAKYPFEVEYLGDQDIWLFFLPSFWRAFNTQTSYRINLGPQPLRVDVRHPRKFKLEFAMPALKSYKRGYALGREAKGFDPRKLCDPQTQVETVRDERDGWGPSELTVRSADMRAGESPATQRGSGWKADPGSETYAAGSEGSRTAKAIGATTAATEALAKLPVKFSRDDVTLDPGGILSTVGTILRLYGMFTGIIAAIREYAPKVGFYIDFDLQLFTGGLAVEWMWKEHDDHRAYAAIDANVKITTVKVMLELGVGVSACGGKLQVFAQVEGSHALDFGYKRVNPDGEGVIPISTSFKITGAIGARAEAGSYVKLEGKGETGFDLKFEIGIGIGEGQQGLTFAVTPTWTGLSFTGTFNAHAFGVSYQKTGKYDLVGPQSMQRLRWPSKKPYRPPVMSKYDIARVFKARFTDGWNVRFYENGDDSVSLDKVCNEIAEAVMADKGFTQKPKDIEALSNSVRQDLDVMGVRDWARDWVEMRELRSYLAGRTLYKGGRALSFAKHLEDGQQDPLLNQAVGT